MDNVFEFRDHADIVAACEFLADECVDYSTDFVNLQLTVLTNQPLPVEIQTWLDENTN
jgi:hypothetical protein